MQQHYQGDEDAKTTLKRQQKISWKYKQSRDKVAINNLSNLTA